MRAATISIERIIPAAHIIGPAPAAVEELHQAGTLLLLDKDRIALFHVTLGRVGIGGTEGQAAARLGISCPELLDISAGGPYRPGRPSLTTRCRAGGQQANQDQHQAML